MATTMVTINTDYFVDNYLWSFSFDPFNGSYFYFNVIRPDMTPVFENPLVFSHSVPKAAYIYYYPRQAMPFEGFSDLERFFFDVSRYIIIDLNIFEDRSLERFEGEFNSIRNFRRTTLAVASARQFNYSIY